MPLDGNAKARAFLAAFAITGDLTRAAAAVPIERTMHYRWLRQSPQYAAAFERAESEFGDALEAAAIARAKEGVLEAVFYQGVAVGAIRKYSDGLMIALLKRFKPDKYAARIAAEVSGPGGGAILTESRLSALTDDELASLGALAQKLSLAAERDSGRDEAPPKAED